MKLLSLVLSEIFGLFVDDKLLAIGVIVLVILAWLSALLAPGYLPGIVLVVGSVGLLVVSTLRGARR
jgi:hypothetical protein